MRRVMLFFGMMVLMSSFVSAILVFEYTDNDSTYPYRENNYIDQLGSNFSVNQSVIITNITVLMKEIGSPSGNLWISLQTCSGNDPSGTVIANSSVVDGSAIGTSAVTVNFPFSSGDILINTEYCMFLDGGTADASNYWRGHYGNDNEANPLFFSTNNGASWANDGTRQLVFAVHGRLEGDAAPIISNINCTSCNVPYGDTSSPYTTSDTTPTFKMDTDIDSICRIGDEDDSYSTMESFRNCSTTGAKNHTCSLMVFDELIYSTDYVYIVCASIDNSSLTNSTGTLQMNITDLDSNTTAAIDTGIAKSVISGATTYSSQKIYLRDINNNQVSATADRVVVDGSQRWIFNYALESESLLGLFNLTPAVYVLDMANISMSDIESQVSTLINSTDS